MRIRLSSAVLLSTTLASALTACGNKGDLVKPTPPPDQQPATQSHPASDSTPKPAESGGTPASPQDSGGH